MAKLKIKLYSDRGESPREWDNVGTMATKHRNYSIGEETVSDPIDWLATKLGYTDRTVSNISEKLNVDYYSEPVKKVLEENFFKAFIVLPLYIYDHSGVSIGTTPFGCRWDSGQLGYIFCTKEEALEEFGGKKVTKKVREKCFSSFVAEVKSYDTWQKGEVYGFNASYGDEEDSCGGFYGTDWENNGILDYLSFEGVSKEKILKKLEKAYSKL
jgi:hypothetical protein